VLESKEMRRRRLELEDSDLGGVRLASASSTDFLGVGGGFALSSMRSGAAWQLQSHWHPDGWCSRDAARVVIILSVVGKVGDVGEMTLDK
jgi:hypothetical protein